MSGRLVLTLRDWGDGTGQLCAEVHSCGFGGSSCAAFDLAELRRRARAFSKFPLNIGETVHIAGGHFSKDDPNILTAEHLYLGVSPANLRGPLTMQVRLSSQYDDGNAARDTHSVSVALTIEYQQLSKFAEDLEALATGTLSEVVLESLDGLP